MQAFVSEGMEVGVVWEMEVGVGMVVSVVVVLVMVAWESVMVKSPTGLINLCDMLALEMSASEHWPSWHPRPPCLGRPPALGMGRRSGLWWLSW